MKYCIGDLEEVGMFDLMQRKNNGNPANRVILPHYFARDVRRGLVKCTIV